MNPEPFFAFARERQNIYLRRMAGEPRPWTDDPILDTCRFTNVYRENDKTTVWFREKVRDPLSGLPEVLPATVLFRWLNRISTGEALFCQPDLLEPQLTAFEGFMDYFIKNKKSDLGTLKEAIMKYCGDGPYVTGAFIINTPTGMTKLDGVLWAFGKFMDNCNYRDAARYMLEGKSMEKAWEWLRTFPRLGDFMAYEIVCDLRYTSILEGATDKLTWANPGPGAKRGLSYLCGGSRKVVPPEVKSRANQIKLMQELLALAPQYGFHDWEMREVEHTCCEFQKFTMVQRGEGKTKGMYR